MRFLLAGLVGVEPTRRESKSRVLPLDYSPIYTQGGTPCGILKRDTQRLRLCVPSMWGGRWDSNPRSSVPQTDALGQLRYTHHIKLARLKGLEPLALCLEGRCSIQLSYRRLSTDGAGDGNRTHATSLEGWGSTIELHPHANGGQITATARAILAYNATLCQGICKKNCILFNGIRKGRLSPPLYLYRFCR